MSIEAATFYMEKLANVLNWLRENPDATAEEAKAFTTAERADIERYKKEQEDAE